MSAVLDAFLEEARAADWDKALRHFGGLNMTEMLKGLAALPHERYSPFLYNASFRLPPEVAAGGGKERIFYALDVFEHNRLPPTAPVSADQVQEAFAFLAGRPVDDWSNPPIGDLTVSQLRLVMPSLPQSKAVTYITLLNRAMSDAEIGTRLRKAAFLAQLAAESGELTKMEEGASGERYEGRRDLGNTHPGDGKRYKGRGPIQLTGRDNYRAAGAALGLDLEGDPLQAAKPEVGFRTAAWFWSQPHKGLNNLADQNNFREITLRVNGGLNGLPARQTFYRRALHAF
jgi:predicted chitinase